MHAFVNRHGLFLSCAVAGLSTVTPAFAQSAQGVANPNDIIVTARRVEERLQDVPISITVFNQQQLTERNVLSGDDLAKITPGLSSNSQFGAEHTAFTLRGFKQDIGTSPTVGVYFGDVVTPRGGSSGTFAGDGAGVGNFFDLQNIQVLKGPQGTLQGRNTTGGAIMLVPQRPTSELEGYVEGGIGNYDAIGVQAVLNVPLADTFRVRLGVDRQKRDGYLRNVTGIGAKDFNDVNYLALRFSAVADLTPDLENYLIASYGKSDTNATANKLIAVNTTGPLTPFVGALSQLQREAEAGFYTAASILPDQGSKKRVWQVINTTTWTANDSLTIKNIASYAELRINNNAQIFGSDFTLFGGPSIYSNMIHTAPGLDNTSQSTFTEELQFQGSAMNNKLRWQAGFYYEKSDPLGASGNQTVAFGNCPDIGTSNGVLLGCYGIPGAGVYNNQVARTSFDDKALYGQATYSFTDQLSLTGGFRYTWDKMSSVAREETFNIAQTATLAPNALLCIETFGPAPAGGCPIVDISKKSSAPTWLIGLDYKPTDDLLLYAKYARGYRAGGVKNDAPNLSRVRDDLPDYTIFNPEKLDAYEIGLKSSFDGFVRGTFNFAAYYNDFSNQQISLGMSLQPLRPNACALTPYTPCPVPAIAGGVPTSAPVNLGKSRTYGFDADLTLNPFDGFTFLAGYAYLNTKAKVVEGVAPVVFLNQIMNTNPQAKVGGPLAYSPKHKLVLNGSYALPLPETVGELSFGATFTYTSSYYTTFGAATAGLNVVVPRDGELVATTADLGRIPSTSLLDLNLTWREVGGSPVDITLWATNVTKKKYLSHVAGTMGYGFDFGQVGAPRLYGMKARVRF